MPVHTEATNAAITCLETADTVQGRPMSAGMFHHRMCCRNRVSQQKHLLTAGGCAARFLLAAMQASRATSSCSRCCPCDSSPALMARSSFSVMWPCFHSCLRYTPRLCNTYMQKRPRKGADHVVWHVNTNILLTACGVTACHHVTHMALSKVSNHSCRPCTSGYAALLA